MFVAPPEKEVEWTDSGLEGSFRFLKRVWAYAAKFGNPGPAMAEALAKATRFEIHSVLKQANYALSKHQFNTVASAAMKILNALERFEGGRNKVTEEGLSILLRLLAPITPHLCHSLWRELGFGEDVMRAAWPEPDAAALQQDEIEYVVQVNGKTRGSVRLPKEADRQQIEGSAAQSMQKYVGNQTIKKVIIVPGRLINIVV
jgi:leucyl-tRNA synthetase